MPESLDDRANDLIALVESLNAGVALSNERIAASNEGIAASNDAIASLDRYGHKSRHWIWLLAVSLLFDLGLSAGFGVVGFKAYQTSQEVKEANAQILVLTEQNRVLTEANRATLIATCLASNVTRTQAVQLWEGLATDAGPAPTPEAQAIRDRLLARVYVTYAQKDCSKI